MKLPKSLHERVTPTPAMLRYWWRALNAAAFRGALPQPHFAVLDDDLGCKAWFETAPYSNPGEGQIGFSKETITRRALLGTMLHEMVHQYQAMSGRPLVHGRFFRVVCRRLGRRVGVQVCES